MNSSWFFDENFNGVPDDFFDDAMKFFDFPLEDVESGDVSDNCWEDKCPHLEPPPLKVPSSGPHGENGCSTASTNRVISCDDASQLKQWPNSNGSLSSRSIPPTHYYLSESKYLKQLQTCSPVSVLESGSGSCTNPVMRSPTFAAPVKRPRSDCPRRRRQELSFISFNLQEKMLSSAKKKQQGKIKNLQVLSTDMEIEKSSTQQPGAIRRCWHCQVTKTPQWREGPMGPKTLCNACGVRYRSGRLYPEYRPAASPTFVPALHSNSHRKVLEMRQKATSAMMA